MLLTLLIGIHLLQVRIRGIVRPYAPTLEEERAREALWGGGRRNKQETTPPTPRPRPSDQASYYRGLRMMLPPFCLQKESEFATNATY